MFETCRTWARNMENGMLKKNVVIQKMKLLTPKRVASQLLNKFKGEWGRKWQHFVTILHLL
jgi:hypothetical protein